ncbi:BPK_HP2_G0024430.mRNA.1.CDS.1 [Saccharomyces cerevisiae]|nr:BPK_HP2_G0024430.mRNA.1.CDS.1 [Saccharomyces cerevisiae]CAI6451730.1 BPK_HP2_G0024430.mRNA.1.CDS.1 [Saccharomyces cerevisiae]
MFSPEVIFPKFMSLLFLKNYIHDIFVDSKHITLSLWDTAGQEEFDRLRSLSYSDTQCIMLCFSIDSRDSLENVQNKWVGEITDHCEGVKLVLVALKCDLRNNENESNAITPNNIQQDNSVSNDNGNNINSTSNGKNLISYEEGLAMAKKIGALRYLECSAKLNKGVNEAFTEAARVALTAGPVATEVKSDSGSSCTIM